ncbi:MAG: nucleotidyl transferase AbiEii/AbiGii toxin family protein [Bacteroidaceae bacterium]|nr:nucleotidyl transferase AbiEii/AbiGii toxin family protein [Bacteroidaceae bacterium]
MIAPKCFTTEWIAEKSQAFKYPDKNLIEKVVRALSLLDMLARSGCPFHFKGGSCLMLLLHDTAHRLSIDIDIMCPPGTNIEDYLKDYADNGFIDYQLVERKQAGTDIPKSHSKFFYQVAFKAESNATSFILLDVLYEDCHYMDTQMVAIESPFVESIGDKVYVRVPSIGDILGDKLTAFAPETTGIPYYKKDKLATLEIIKQLYDVGRVFDKVGDIAIASETFRRIAPVELGYRGLKSDNLDLVFDDIRNTALNISTRGFVDKEKFALLQKGINSIGSFMYLGTYHIETAVTDAAKAAYLATLIQHDIAKIEHYGGDVDALATMSVNTLTNKLNKLKLGNPEAYYYWCKTDAILSETSAG